jgi:hypothetical protein
MTMIMPTSGLTCLRLPTPVAAAGIRAIDAEAPGTLLAGHLPPLLHNKTLTQSRRRGTLVRLADVANRIMPRTPLR